MNAVQLRKGGDKKLAINIKEVNLQGDFNN